MDKQPEKLKEIVGNEGMIGRKKVEELRIDCPACGPCDRSCDNCPYCSTDVNEPYHEN